MKKIALLFSLLLVVFFGFYMISDFTSVSFNYLEFLTFLVVAIIVYFIIKAVGNSLDKKFNNSLKKFLDGEEKELFKDKKLLSTFGLLLITLLPFLFYLLILSLFAAIDFALYGFMLISYSPYIPYAVLIGFAVVLIGTGISILFGFIYVFFPPEKKTFGIEINQKEQIQIWDLVKDIAKEIKAKPIDKIIIIPDPGIGVYLQGNLFSTIFGGGKRVLEIGLPSLHNLTVDEFKAILAHEYGHFSNRDTSWSSYTYCMGNSLMATLRSVPGPQSLQKNEKAGIIQAMMALNPAYWLLLVYVKLYFKVTNGFSRIREVMADIIAMKLYGGKAFGNGLLKVATNDAIFNELIQTKYVPELLKEEKTISNFSRFMETIFSGLTKEKIEEIQNDIISKRQIHNVYDSHPALKIRIDYSKKFGDMPEKDARSVDKLFDDWDEINKKIANLYNLRLMYLTGKLKPAEVKT